MWYVWVIIILAILSILTVSIIIPVFNAWYFSSVIFISVGIVIIVIGALWYKNIRNSNLGNLQEDQNSIIGPIISIIFGILLIITGVILGLIRYRTEILEVSIAASMESKMTEEDCLQLLPFSKKGGLAYTECKRQYPELVEKYEKKAITSDQCLEFLLNARPKSENVIYKLCENLYPETVKQYNDIVNKKI